MSGSYFLRKKALRRFINVRRCATGMFAALMFAETIANILALGDGDLRFGGEGDLRFGGEGDLRFGGEGVRRRGDGSLYA
jgi:hypothetical protein